MHLEMFYLVGELAQQIPCDVRHEWGAHITFGFGWPDKVIDWSNACGWVLRFEEAEWRVDGPEGFICNCHDEDYFNSVMRFRNQNWGALKQISFPGPLLDLQLTFESGAVVTAVVTPEETGEIQWQLQNPMGTRLRVYGGGSWTIHNAGDAAPSLFWSPRSGKINLEHEPVLHRIQ